MRGHAFIHVEQCYITLVQFSFVFQQLEVCSPVFSVVCQIYPFAKRWAVKLQNIENLLLPSRFLLEQSLFFPHARHEILFLISTHKKHFHKTKWHKPSVMEGWEQHINSNPAIKLIYSKPELCVGPGSDLRMLKRRVRPNSSLHTKMFRNDGRFCRQLLPRQASWLNRQ